MIVKWLKKTGNGSARATVDYMLGRDRNRPCAAVLRGNAEETAQLADNLRHKHKYAVGVLSFEEKYKDIDTDKINAIMDSFESTIFAGLDREQYNICWIAHWDKNERLELNFIIPKVELRSGKAMNPYLHSKDLSLIDSWKNIINEEYRLSDPNDPTKRHNTTHQQRLPKDKKEIASAIDEAITDAISAGLINNRDQIIEYLSSVFGLQVTKTTKQSISVHHADMGKRPLRLTGKYYEQDFDSSREHPKQIEIRASEYRASNTTRLRAFKQEYQEHLESRVRYNQDRYTRDSIAISDRSRRRIAGYSDREHQELNPTDSRDSNKTDQRPRITNLEAIPSRDTSRSSQAASDNSEYAESSEYNAKYNRQQDTDDRRGKSISTATDREAGFNLASNTERTARIRQQNQQNQKRSVHDRILGNEEAIGLSSTNRAEYRTRIRSDKQENGRNTSTIQQSNREHQQDNRQPATSNSDEAIHQNIQAADNHILPVGVYADSQLSIMHNQEQQRRDIGIESTDSKSSSNDRPAKQHNQYSDRSPSYELNHDREDISGLSDQVKASNANRYNPSRRFIADSKNPSHINQNTGITNNESILSQFRSAFKRIREKTRAAAEQLLTAIQDTIRRIGTSSDRASAVNQQLNASESAAANADRAINNTITAAQQRESTITTTNQRINSSKQRITDCVTDNQQVFDYIEEKQSRFDRYIRQRDKWIQATNNRTTELVAAAKLRLERRQQQEHKRQQGRSYSGPSPF